MQERDRHARALQDRENELSEAKLKASDLRNQVQQRTHLEESVGHYKKQIASSTAELKVSLCTTSMVALSLTQSTGNRWQGCSRTSPDRTARQGL
jgi:hypothetical protein